MIAGILSHFPNYLSLRLEPEEMANPLLVMDELYRNQTEFPVWRNELYIWFKGLFHPEPQWTGRNPGDMLYRVEQIEKLLEASWLLQEFKLRPDPIGEITEKDVYPDTATNSRTMKYWYWDFYPRWLDREELEQPYLVLDRFFVYNSLAEWKEILYEWLKRSLSSTPFEDAGEVIICYEYLNKLFEATHLIYLRDRRKNIK